MKIMRDYRHAPDRTQAGVVALGNFDGVHKGHVAVIKQAKDLAAVSGANVSVLTFEPHPVSVIKSDARPFRLTLEQQKIDLFSVLKIDNLFIVEFTREFSRISAGDFVRKVLAKAIGASHIVTGEDFVFGAGREGNATKMLELTQECNLGYTRVLPVGSDEELFSSSLIRKYLKEGRLHKARQMLGRNFVIEGEVTQGKQLGKTIGFPTINIVLQDYLRPAFGVYAVCVMVEGYPDIFYGAANIGVRPTLDGQGDLLEVHIFDFADRIYGRKVKVELLEFIRPEQKFSGIEALQNQIQEDCRMIQAIIHKHGHKTAGA